MTHFASAADYSTDQTAIQLAYFHAIAAELRAAGVRPRSSAHLQHQRDRVRPHRRLAQHWCAPGHALYGYVSPARGDAPPQLLDVQPALTWKAKLLAVKDIPEGALVGYGGSFRAPRPCASGSSAPGTPTACSTGCPTAARSSRAGTDAHPRHDFDGPDHHRPQPHRRRSAGRRRDAARDRRARPRSTRSRSRRSRGPSPTTSCAASARAFDECTFKHPSGTVPNVLGKFVVGTKNALFG